MHFSRFFFMLLLFSLFTGMSCSSSLFAQASKKGYEIILEVENLEDKQVFLANYYGDKPYIKDSIMAKDGRMVFKGDEALDGGIYLAVLPPNNQFVQFFISDGEQHFKIKADAANLAGSVEVEGSVDNKLFYDYMNFLGGQLDKKTAIEAKKAAAGDNQKKLDAITEEFKQLDQEVKDFHRDVLTHYPKTLTAAFIANRIDVDVPDFEGTEEEVHEKQWQYVKNHYFDMLDMTDPRLVRAPFLYQKIDHFINKLTVQHPDSLARSIDQVLTLVKPSEPTFKYYLVHFLNMFAKSKIVGMDAVYVHIVDNYYAKGLAPWTEEEQLKKIVKNANTLRPILIGKVAPNIQVEKQDKSKIKLHDVDHELTILFFWSPDCGHCKKAMPHMVDFYKEYKSKDVEIFGVCTEVQDKCEKCWPAIEEKNMGDWINTTDPFLRSRYKVIYDIRTTPQIFILDKDKKIISKRIGAEQVKGVVDEYFEIKKRKAELESGK